MNDDSDCTAVDSLVGSFAEKAFMVVDDADNEVLSCQYDLLSSLSSCSNTTTSTTCGSDSDSDMSVSLEPEEYDGFGRFHPVD